MLDLNFDGYDDLVGYYNDRFVSGEIVAKSFQTPHSFE